MFAVANRWVDRLTYVCPVREPWTKNWRSGFSENIQEDRFTDGAPCDLMGIHFRNRDWKTGVLELRHCSRETLMSGSGDIDLEPVIHVEPPVPFAFVALRNFSFTGFTHMVVARSPRFAPAAADKLLPIIREYFIRC